MRTTEKRVVDVGPVDPYAVAWGVLGGIGIAFEITLASTGHKHHTLSAYLRRALGLDPRQPWAAAGLTTLGVGVAWFGLHVGLNILPRQPTASSSVDG